MPLGLSSFGPEDRQQFGRNLRLAMACIEGKVVSADTRDLPSDIPAIRQRLMALSQDMTSQHADLLELLVKFDDMEGYKASGASHCAAWMNIEIGIHVKLAWEYLRVGRKLQRLPTTRALFRGGKLSWSKVRVMVNVANEENEKILCHAALDASVSDVVGLCRGYRWNDDELDENAGESARAMQRWEARSLTWDEASNGNTRIRLSLPPEIARAFLNSVEHSLNQMEESDDKFTQRRADAAVLMAETSLQSAGRDFAVADRYQVIVSVDANELAEKRLTKGVTPDAETVAHSDLTPTADPDPTSIIDRGFAPIPDPDLAPTPDPDLAPTPDPDLAPTPDPELAPTPDPELAPTPDPELTPTPDPELTPTADLELTPVTNSGLTPSCYSNLAFNSKLDSVPVSDSNASPSHESRVASNTDSDQIPTAGSAVTITHSDFASITKAGTAVSNMIEASEIDRSNSTTQQETEAAESKVHSVGIPAKRPTVRGAGPIARETARRIACDCCVTTNSTSNGEPVDIGRKSRLWPPAMARAIKERDQHCQFYGCNQSYNLQIHHIVHWADGGTTCVSNGVCLCQHHHTMVHEGGYTIQMVDNNEKYLCEQFAEHQHAEDTKQTGVEKTLRADQSSFSIVRHLLPTRYRFRIVDKSGRDIRGEQVCKADNTGSVYSTVQGRSSSAFCAEPAPRNYLPVTGTLADPDSGNCGVCVELADYSLAAYINFEAEVNAFCNRYPIVHPLSTVHSTRVESTGLALRNCLPGTK